MRHDKGFERAILAVALLVGAFHSTSALAAPFMQGHVLTGVANGSYQHYDENGSLLETLSDGMGGFTTGGAFDTQGRFYATNFAATKVVVYNGPGDPHNILQVIDTAAWGGGACESIVFNNNGDFYVGHASGNADIQRYNAAGVFQQQYDVATENVGSDWIELSIDQRTMYYTSEGRRVLRFDLMANVQLPDFAVLPDGRAFAFRFLPPFDGSGGLIVADEATIRRLDGSGTIVQTYDAPGEDNWFSMNVAPGGASFWAGDFETGNFYRFNIQTGAIELGPINTGTGSSTLFGIVVFGEIRGCSGSPTCSIDPTLPDSVCVGQAVRFTVTGQTANADFCGPVAVSVSGLPGDASMNPTLPQTGNTVTSVFSWTPGTGDVGTHVVEYSVQHQDAGTPIGEPSVCQARIRVVECNRDPVCSNASPSIAELWPPNHSMVNVDILGVTDPDGDPVTITITGITQDEPVDAKGDGHTSPDGTGVGTPTASVRAERVGGDSGPGNGRVYRICFVASDGRGGKCDACVTVCVPHDQGDATDIWSSGAREGRIRGPRRPRCVDDGQIYDSTVGSSRTHVAGAGPFGVRVSPNPFNPSTTIEYSLSEPSQVSVAIYNALGKLVRTLVSGEQSPGLQSALWNGRDETGRLLPSGVYLYRVQAGGLEQTGRMLLMK